MEAKTDPDGRYKIVSIPPGKYHVTAIAPGHFQQFPRGQVSDLPVTDLSSGKTAQVDVRLERVALIRGKVLDVAGRPVGGALVTAQTQVLDYGAEYTTTRSLGDGSFILATGLIGRSLPLAAFTSADGLATMQVKPPQSGQIADGVVLRMNGAARVRGTVVDPDGKPLKDVNCIAQTGSEIGDWTGPEGRFDLGRIALPAAGKVSLSIRAPRPNPGPWKEYKIEDISKAPPTFYLHQQAVQQLGPGKEYDLKFTLKPTPLLRLSGTVVDAAGAPVAEARVVLFTGDATKETWLETLHPKFDGDFKMAPRATAIVGTQTDKDGHWVLWTVRNGGPAAFFYGQQNDWTRFCVGVEVPKGKSLLVRDVSIPDDKTQLELLINPDTGESQFPGSQPATNPAATQPATAPTSGQSTRPVTVTATSTVSTHGETK